MTKSYIPGTQVVILLYSGNILTCRIAVFDSDVRCKELSVQASFSHPRKIDTSPVVLFPKIKTIPHNVKRRVTVGINRKVVLMYFICPFDELFLIVAASGQKDDCKQGN